MKILALGFLLMIGMTLVPAPSARRSERLHLYCDYLLGVYLQHQHIHQRCDAPVQLRNPYGEETDVDGDEHRALEEAGMTPGRS